MPDTQTVTLAEYIDTVLKERDLSIRAFATYADISHSTLRRVLAGEAADFDTYSKIAKYLKLNVIKVYDMAGVIPPGELDELLREQAAQKDESEAGIDERAVLSQVLLDELRALMKELPESSQRKILAMARLEYEYAVKDHESDDEPEQAHKVS